MKSILILTLQLVLLKSALAQAPPQTPPVSIEEIARTNAFIKTYEISNTFVGNMILHTNRFFSLSCKNRGQIRPYKGFIWMFTSKVFFNRNTGAYYDRSEPGTAIYGFEKQYYLQRNIRQELRQFGYDETFDNWNPDKLGEYYFTYRDNKSQLPSNTNIKTAGPVARSKVNIDGIDFNKYEFKVNIDGVDLIESNYLAVIDNFVFIIHQRKSPTDREDVIKTFRRKR